MYSTDRNRTAHPVYRSLRFRALLLGIAGALGLVAAPAVAQAASRPATTQGRQVLARTARPLSSSICSKVSAASVSSIVGYTVPAGTTYINRVTPTTANFETSAVETSCIYGAQTSTAASLKSVTLSFDVLSKALTESQIQQSIAKKIPAKMKFTSYSGLGVPAFHISMTAPGISAQDMTAILNGTHNAGVFVLTKNLSMSKLAALVKLAEKL